MRSFIIRVLNIIKQHICKVLILVWMVFAGIISISSMEERYQRLANSHTAMFEEKELFPIFIIFLIAGINEFRKKRIFVGVLASMIVIWCFYLLFIAGPFVCTSCTYGG